MTLYGLRTTVDDVEQVRYYERLADIVTLAVHVAAEHGDELDAIEVFAFEERPLDRIEEGAYEALREQLV